MATGFLAMERDLQEGGKTESREFGIYPTSRLPAFLRSPSLPVVTCSKNLAYPTSARRGSEAVPESVEQRGKGESNDSDHALADESLPCACETRPRPCGRRHEGGHRDGQAPEGRGARGFGQTRTWQDPMHPRQSHHEGQRLCQHPSRAEQLEPRTGLLHGWRKARQEPSPEK